MILEEPYFMKNKDWYYDDIEEGILKLTDKAPPEAIKSYKEFYDNLKMVKSTKKDKRNTD